MQFIDLLLVRCIFGGQIGHNNYEDFEHPTCKGNYLWHNRVALTIIFADEKKEEKNSFILYTFVKFALVTEQKLNIEEYSISSVNPVPFQA